MMNTWSDWDKDHGVTWSWQHDGEHWECRKTQGSQNINNTDPLSSPETPAFGPCEGLMMTRRKPKHAPGEHVEFTQNLPSKFPICDLAVR